MESTLESATTHYQGHDMHPESSFPPKCLPRSFRSDGWAVKVLLVMAGGSLGALSRHGVSLLATSLFGSRFPWGTLIVNLTGCFLIGLCFALADRGFRLMTPSARLFFMTGFLGALTTFSAFALESVNAMRAEAHLVMAANLLLNNVLGGALVFLGMWVGRRP
ncbi:MAG: CrcB family protein [Syntrophobacteraceae bacterium]|nr:CrcB family protein [Syntrophobacteraceae bacterium]